MWRKALRILGRSLVALSALLSVGTAVLWIRCGNFASDEGELVWGKGYGVHSLEGRVLFSVFWNPHWTTGVLPSVRIDRDYRESAGFWSFFVMHEYGRVVGPFGVATIDLPPSDAIRPNVRELMVPHYFLIGMFSPLPAWAAFRRFKVRRRISAGRCALCGYDLRESPDRCPECGSIAARPAAT